MTISARTRRPASSRPSPRSARRPAGQSSTSLVGGLFMADNTGQCLQSEFNARLWWSFRNGAVPPKRMPRSMAGAITKDYGVVLTSLGQGLRDKYPTFYCLKLMQYFARGGDTVVTANSPSSLLSTYAVKRQNGDADLAGHQQEPRPELDRQFQSRRPPGEHQPDASIPTAFPRTTRPATPMGRRTSPSAAPRRPIPPTSASPSRRIRPRWWWCRRRRPLHQPVSDAASPSRTTIAAKC